MMEKWDNGKYRKARKMGGKKGFYFPLLCLVGGIEKWKDGK
jgi:hypothetical protein